MKAITIKEPWASLIINGHKEYEFRSWKTKYRGKILIHAGLSQDINNLERFKDYNLNYAHGEIIGEATITDCIEVDETFLNNLRKKGPIVYETSRYNQKYAFKLENIKKYKKRIPCKGKLSIWNYEENSI